MNKNIFVCSSVLIVWLACVACTNADVVSTFDVDLDGWTLPDPEDAVYDWQSTGGNPGGFAHFVDGLGDNSTFITAPIEFLGDWSALNNSGVISFDHLIADAGTGNTIVPFEVFLSGPGGSARITENHPGTIGQWLSFSANLDESLWTIESGTWSGLLNDVTQFDVRIEHVDNHNDLGDEEGIDNISLSSVPEPSVFIVLSMLGCVVLTHRRRHQSAGLISKLALLFAVVFSCVPAQAQIDWNNFGGSNDPDPWLHDPNNWNGGSLPSSTDTARFNSSRSYEVWWDAMTPARIGDVGFLQMLGGDVTFLNQDTRAQHELIVNGSGGNGSFSDFTISGSDTTLTNRGLHLRSRGGAEITGGATFIIDGSHAVGAKFTVEGNDAFDVSGNLNIQNGGVVSSNGGFIGRETGTTGYVTVSGNGSQWLDSSDLVIGSNGTGHLSIHSGGMVSSNYATISGESTARISGGGSRWDTSYLAFGGNGGTEQLQVENGGVVTSSTALITSNGTATVTGGGSQWNVEHLQIGTHRTSILNVNNSGRVTVADTTIVDNVGTLNVNDGTFEGGINFLTEGNVELNAGLLDVSSTRYDQLGGTTNVNGGVLRSNDFQIDEGTFTVDGGRFEFGSTTASNLGTLNLVSGSLAGDINLNGPTNVATLTTLQNNSVDMSDVYVRNSGTLYGSAFLDSALTNLSHGDVRTSANDWVRFAGTGNVNAGVINNFGGTTEFANDLTNENNAEINNFGGTIIAGQLVNESSGFIGGRGQFIVDGGWSNRGVMAFSGGPTDVLGDGMNEAGGQIVTSGDATTTFYDDIVHNGAEIRTADGSNTVFLGSLSGAGRFSGIGDVLIEGDLRPGNSPGIIDFEGDVSLGSNLISYFEIAGTELGEFDRLNIAGDLSLDGLLTVDLIDGFDLGYNQHFVIADVGGSLFGQFEGLDEGGLVGNFGGRDLFITYGAGNGNDVGLFTVVPEPGAVGLLASGTIALLLRRRRSNSSCC